MCYCTGLAKPKLEVVNKAYLQHLNANVYAVRVLESTY